MFWIKTISTAIFIPLLMSLFFYLKERVIYKRKAVFTLLQTKREDSFSLINLILAFVMVSLAMFLLYFVFAIYELWEPTDIVKLAANLTVYIFIGVMFFLMIYHHRINKYRKILFILYAVMFSVAFMSDIYEARGHLYAFTTENVIQQEIPKCQIGIMQNLLPAIFKRSLISPGKIFYNGIGVVYTIGGLFIMWLAASMVLGRGWCSWTCMWGGWDDGFSSIKKKKVIKKCSPKLRWLPFATLIVVLVSSFLLMTPTYCWWLCPFKAISEGPALTSLIPVVQTILFLSLFVVLVIVLPILTRKRTQCAYLCPFGAFQSLVDKVSIFKVKIDRESCVDCKKCLNECPISSITEQSLASGSVGLTCTKCGKCIDICPKNAISYNMKGISNKGRFGSIFSFFSRYIFLFVAFFFLALMGGGTIISGLYRIFLFATTGSFVN